MIRILGFDMMKCYHEKMVAYVKELIAEGGGTGGGVTAAEFAEYKASTNASIAAHGTSIASNTAAITTNTNSIASLRNVATATSNGLMSKEDKSILDLAKLFTTGVVFDLSTSGDKSVISTYMAAGANIVAELVEATNVQLVSGSSDQFYIVVMKDVDNTIEEAFTLETTGETGKVALSDTYSSYGDKKLDIKLTSHVAGGTLKVRVYIR